MHISEDESKIYNLLLTRAEIKKDGIFSDFQKQLFETKTDICRARLPVTNAVFLEQLSASNIWFNITNINFKYKISIPPRVPLDDLKDYRVNTVKKINSEILEIVKNIYSQRGWVTYNLTLSHLFFPEMQVMDAVIKWVDGYTFKTGHFLWALYYKNEMVGIYMGHEDNENFIGDLYGIHSKHRGQRHSSAIYRFMISYCSQKGFKQFINDIGIANIFSQKSALSSGLIPQDAFFYMEIFPFLSLMHNIVSETKNKNHFKIILDKYGNSYEIANLSKVFYYQNTEKITRNTLLAEIKETDSIKIVAAVSPGNDGSPREVTYAFLKKN